MLNNREIRVSGKGNSFTISPDHRLGKKLKMKRRELRVCALIIMFNTENKEIKCPGVVI